jgi:hypothetical protein
MHASYEDWAEVDSHEDWFAHDVYGNRIVNTNWGWHLMDPSSAGWRQHYTSYVNSKMSHSQFDGLFVDDCWNDFRTYESWNIPLSNIPSSFRDNFHSYIIGFLQYLKANISPGKIIVVNTDEWVTHDYLNIADGKMDEGFAHASWQDFSTFDSRMPQILDDIARDSATGKIVWCASGAVIPPNPDATVKYCYAAFLLALNGSQAYLSFDVGNNDGSNGYYPIMDTNIGQATGTYYASQNVYMRDFTGGKVLLNPSTNTFTVNLGGNYKLLDGTVVSSVVLTPYSGEILLSPT